MSRSANVDAKIHWYDALQAIEKMTTFYQPELVRAGSEGMVRAVIAKEYKPSEDDLQRFTLSDAERLEAAALRIRGLLYFKECHEPQWAENVDDRTFVRCTVCGKEKDDATANHKPLMEE